MIDYDTIFRDAHPKAIDFPAAEFAAAAEEIRNAAAAHGYRLAGIRLDRAVFSTKPRAPEAPNELIAA